ncbi:MAG: leucine-rich repeat domain-containing protein [Oscillospiraceae bacterium]|nr:leucine-rich repeat domain-containing protein [Oscillospiraceae bacterium]
MSKLTEKINELASTEGKTVIVNRSDIEDELRRASEERTVVDEKPAVDSRLDPELEAILRETEGYAFEPEIEEESVRKPKRSPSENARRVIEEKADERKTRGKKRVIIICGIVVAVLALMLVGTLLLKNSAQNREYEQAYKQAQLLYYDGKYDEALEQLRNAMAIDKTDDCLLLMSQCYEAKCDYVNAIAILESSSSGSDVIKKRIEFLEEAKERYESGQVVLLCGEQYDIKTTVLDLSGKDIRSGRLSDIGRLTELTSLKLADNEITELEFLTPLQKLVSLDLSNNQISDITPLAQLKKLRTLHLDNNDIKDFSPLYDLSELTMLTIGGIEVSQSQIKELKTRLPGCLIYNDEANTDIVEVHLGGKTFKSDVTKLDLSDCSITDLSALSVCTGLEELRLSGNYIRDISPLLDIPKLRVLDLSNNMISDIRPLMSMTTLEHLNLAGNKISSITALSQLKQLKELVLNGNDIDGTQNLAKLSALKILGLKETGISDADLEKLYNLKNLTVLALENNPDITESGVNQLKKKLPQCKVTHSEFEKKIVLGGKEFSASTESVDASSLGISDISAAAGFKSVRHLDLSNNVISSVSALSSLKTLETLDLSDNNIGDVSPLYSLKNLKMLHIEQNGLSAEQVSELRAALPDCTIIVE